MASTVTGRTGATPSQRWINLARLGKLCSAATAVSASSGSWNSSAPHRPSTLGRRRAVERNSSRLSGILLATTLALAGHSREDGRPGSLDPNGLDCLFDDVPSLLDRVRGLAASANTDAQAVLLSVKLSLSFRGGSIKGWIEHRRGTDGDGRTETVVASEMINASVTLAKTHVRPFRLCCSLPNFRHSVRSVWGGLGKWRGHSARTRPVGCRYGSSGPDWTASFSNPPTPRRCRPRPSSVKTSVVSSAAFNSSGAVSP